MNSKALSPERGISLIRSLHSTRIVSGFTHNFYRYPARMSPDFVRQAISTFTRAGDTILDPFLGGGTTMVEALAHGRRSIGVDLNPLATFVSSVKTTPLSKSDKLAVTNWVSAAPILEISRSMPSTPLFDPRVKNLPPPLVNIFEQLLANLNEMPFPRQRQFVRCALLRLGQWAVDGKDGAVDPEELKQELEAVIQEMLRGLDQLVQSAVASGVKVNQMTGYRSILLRSTVGLENVLGINSRSRPLLVLTSPPYPGVHILYHRWQVDGRRETPAPYWLIDSPDGHSAAHFTMGGRSQIGIETYYRNITAAFQSVRAVIDPNGIVLQLVSFANVETQLPLFLQAMEAAGFREDVESAGGRADLWRTVPNRKWYYRIDATRESARELLLVHRPA